MAHTIPFTNLPKFYKWKQISRYGLVLLVVSLVFGLAVFQDYIFSELKHTGFYLSESLLYNTFWVFFIPLSVPMYRLYALLKKRPAGQRYLIGILAGVVQSFVHILVFAGFFVFISSLIYHPSHRFERIFNTVLAQQWYIALLWYVVSPFVVDRFKKKPLTTKTVPKHITTKQGRRSIKIPISEIKAITVDKPYTVIWTLDQKYLDNRSLKTFESVLDPEQFKRVHRSVIVKEDAISSLTSRKNGDYDALLTHGQHIRLSRHYRHNWHQLLH